MWNVPTTAPRPRCRRAGAPTGASTSRDFLRRKLLGDEFAESILETLTEPERERIVQAMEDVERLLRVASTTITVEDPSNKDARWCVDQYFAELGERLESGFDSGFSISADPQETMPPHGAFLVARLDGQPVGCGALKTVAAGIGTIKRMWVAKSARRTGLGTRILLALEKEARNLGFTLLRLETNRALEEAQNLYRKNGYQGVDPFNDENYAHHWFEKNIQEMK